jgi:enoyl-CoA hydratase
MRLPRMATIDLMTEHLTVTRRDSISLLAIDDGKANALSGELIADIAGALDEAENDASTTAVVLSGRPGVFSAGFDLNVMRSGDRAATVGLVSDGGSLVRKLYGLSVPVVAACSGHAVAAGALLLLGCDVRIGTDGPFTIGLNEVSIGMVLPDWAEAIASTRLHRPHYHRCVFNARLTDPQGAIEAGFLDELAAADHVLDAAIVEAERLSSLDRAAYRGSVERFRGPTLERMASLIAADRATAAS